MSSTIESLDSIDSTAEISDEEFVKDVLEKAGQYNKGIFWFELRNLQSKKNTRAELLKLYKSHTESKAASASKATGNWRRQ